MTHHTYILAAAVAALSVVSALADKTTNTFTRTSSQKDPIEWSATGLPSSEIQATTGYDIAIKIDYAEGGEKYQQLKTPNLPLYLDSVIGGKYHNIGFVLSNTKSHTYAVINDPTPFEGFWSIADGPARACGIFLPDTGEEGTRTIGSAFLKGRFQFGVPTGYEGILDYPFGLGMFEVNRYSDMTPSIQAKGKLTVNRSPGPWSAVQVRTGTLALVGGDDDATSPVPGAWARFDATSVDSFTMDSEGNVTTWSDADGNGVSMSIEYNANKPIRREDSVTGKTLVDFCIRSGIADRTRNGSRLKFPEAKEDIAEVFFVFRDNSSSQAGHIIDTAFPRQGNVNYLFKGWGSLPKGLMMGEFRLNGQAVVPDVAYDFTRGLNVVSASYRSGGGSVRYVAGAVGSDSAGGLQLAEILFYTNALTAAERRHNNDYLMKKWKGVGVRDYGAIMLAKSASLSVESGTAHVRELQLATNGFVKAGSGNLEIESLNTNLNSLVVNGGSVRFVNTLNRGGNPQPAADPFAWFDADDETSFTTFTSNYTGNAGTLAPTNYTFITSWRDKRNNGYTLSRVGTVTHVNCNGGKNTPATTDETALPTLDTETWTLPMVDLGPFYNPGYWFHYGWINGNSGLSTWLRLYKNGSANGGATRQGFVVFYKTNQNGNPINSSNWDLRNSGSSNPSSRFLHDQYAGTAALGGHWTYDGVTVNPGEISLPADGKAHLGSFMFADGAPCVNVFGADMDVSGNSAGGCKIAEVILYDRVLTEQERLDTERYLMAKWNCGTHPADRSISSVGTLSFGAGVLSAIDTDSNMTYGKLVRESSGAVVKKGAGNATVSLFDPNATDVTAVTVEDGSLTLTCDPLADAWAHVDASREDSIVYETVNGTNFVSRWKDISGHGNDATNPYYTIAPKQKPVYRTVHLDDNNILADSGREVPVVDFGEYYNYEQLPSEGRTAYPTNTASGLNFPEKDALLQEFYIVHADIDHWEGDGAGHNNNYCGILGYYGSGGPDGTQHPFLRASKSPVISDVGNRLIRGGYIGVNGETKNANYSPTFKQLNVYAISAAGQVSNKWCLAHRGNTQWGGQVLGEVILFQTTNTVERRNAITSMLLNKWRGQESQTPLTSSWTLGSLSVANGSSLTVNAVEGFAYTATNLLGNGSIFSACPILGVQRLAAGTAGVGGTLSVAADVTLADNAVLDVYVGEDGNVGKVAITGTLTVGGSGTVVVHVPEGVMPDFGSYDIVTATQFAGVLGNWTLDASAITRGSVSLGYDAQRGAILLNIRPTGTILVFR